MTLLTSIRSKFGNSLMGQKLFPKKSDKSVVASVQVHTVAVNENVPIVMIKKEELLNSFLAPILHHRSDSAETLMTPETDLLPEALTVDITDQVLEAAVPTALDLISLPTELFTLIAMSSGFIGSMTLRKTCHRFRKILSEKYSWASFTSRSPDVIHTVVHVETKLHQFDQIMFCKWLLGGKIVPSIVHRTFLEQYDFLGGLSLNVQDSGRVIR
jgi:hypothetical protein